MTAGKPRRMTIDFKKIPQELKKKDRWILWRWENRNGNWTKPPYQLNGRPAKSNDSKTWNSYDAVMNAYQSGEWDGIGFMLGGELIGFDWDDCLESGQVQPDILDWVRLIDTYTEISPSGNGLKSLAIGKLPGGGHHAKQIAVFNNGRYFCITGRIFPGVSSKIESRQEALLELVKAMWPDDLKSPQKPSKPKPAHYYQPPADILTIALKDAKFSRLWNGDFSQYPSQSEGDQAFCNKLAFYTGKNPVQMDALFRQSGLMRDKWERRDYRERTIQRAIDSTREAFTPSDQLTRKTNISRGGPKKKPGQKPISALEAFETHFVKERYTTMLGNEKFLFENLIISNQITILIAKPGGGKTTILFNFVSPKMIQAHGVDVLFVDCDSPASDHKRMFEIAKSHGEHFRWINPLTHGKDPAVLLGLLKAMVNQQTRLDEKVFIFDTLKKFVDVMQKTSTKPFFKMLRQLVSLGATIVLLGHANKYRNTGGHLVFEGVQDVQADADALIYFERMGSIGGIDVTTVVDPDKGAKVRGLFEPISFHIDENRNVTQYGKAFDPPDYSPEAKKRKTISNEKIEDAIRTYLKKQSTRIKQSDLIDEISKVSQIGQNRIHKVLSIVSVEVTKASRPGQIYYSVGYRGVKSYQVHD